MRRRAPPCWPQWVRCNSKSCSGVSRASTTRSRA
jgi:hypothetical protein